AARPPTSSPPCATSGVALGRRPSWAVSPRASTTSRPTPSRCGSPHSRSSAMSIRRRSLLKLTAAAGLAPAVASAQGAGAGRVVVIGGGFGGATVARTVKSLEPKITVTLVEPNRIFTACPFSNGVLAAIREISQQQFGYDGVTKSGVTLAQTSATAVD